MKQENNLRKLVIYLHEITQEPTISFRKYFYSDIANYLDIDYLINCNDTNKILQHLQALIADKNKYDLLLGCKTKDNVKEWLDGITSYIIKNINEQQLIYEYLNE